MKKWILILCSLFAVTVYACTKPGTEENGEEALYQNSPSSKVPEEFLGKRWLQHYVGILHYLDKTPFTLSTDRNDYGQVYKFSNGGPDGKQGRYEYHGYLGNRTNFGKCITHNLQTTKGTVKFEGNVVSFYPLEGTKTLEKKGCETADTKTQEKIPASDLKPASYLWKYSTDAAGYWAFRLYKLTDTNMENEVHAFRKVD
ncbi:hypothetical protein EXU57_14765 [Segetibacter sp. 3557_3]|uniref:hypothetical protein n=1 Tax=Segetibacter sp. 3557_3 TaxID=2547429 RepID=UPI001058AB04|nr:hypothetical protein [Segetibacter sp. 3557_3]TDH24599.1 hypothetical protein EXU57_14765 [Segetibacter sp. 3557_3]